MKEPEQDRMCGSVPVVFSSQLQEEEVIKVAIEGNEKGAINGINGKVPVESECINGVGNSGVCKAEMRVQDFSTEGNRLNKGNLGIGEKGVEGNLVGLDLGFLGDAPQTNVNKDEFNKESPKSPLRGDFRRRKGKGIQFSNRPGREGKLGFFRYGSEVLCGKRKLEQVGLEVSRSCKKARGMGGSLVDDEQCAVVVVTECLVSPTEEAALEALVSVDRSSPARRTQ